MPTKKSTSAEDADEPRAHYDFRKGVRGKYAARLLAGATVVVLDPKIAASFPDSDAVNTALRGLLRRRRSPRAPA